MSAAFNADDDQGVFDSRDTILVEITGQPLPPQPHTAASLLSLMRHRILYYGSPVPEGFVPPPGVDLDDLLRQVPWPPSAEGGAAQGE